MKTETAKPNGLWYRVERLVFGRSFLNGLLAEVDQPKRGLFESSRSATKRWNDARKRLGYTIRP